MRQHLNNRFQQLQQKNKFARELENSKTMNFLDMILINTKNKLEKNWHRKST